MVDYSKFANIEDSDDEPVWETKETSQKYKGFPQKVTDELDAAARGLSSASKCHCYLDFAVEPHLLKGYEQEMIDASSKIPENRYLGRVVIELDQAQYAPKLCENFRLLCSGERGAGVGGKRLHYKDRTLDLILPKYCIQASIPNELSCWGKYLQDENLVLPNGTCFDKPGLVAIGNHGPDTNSCTFMITLNEASHLDGYNQIIGRVVRGMEVLRIIEGLPTDRKTQSFAERNVKTHWGGRPMADVVIENCGVVTDDQLVMAVPEDGDLFPEHPIDYSVKSDEQMLMAAQEQIREVGNSYYKQHKYKEALEKYRKALGYLEPLLKKQHMNEFKDEEAHTMLAGGVRPKDRTEPVRADLTIKMNVCQVLLSMGEWRAAIAIADEVVLTLVGKHSRKGHGALPNDPLVVKALFKRAKARIGLSDVSGELSQLEEATDDLRQALLVEPENAEVKSELDKVRVRQMSVDDKSRAVYEKMVRSQ